MHTLPVTHNNTNSNKHHWKFKKGEIKRKILALISSIFHSLAHIQNYKTSAQEVS
jgi:hypothetical protein